MSNRLTGVAAGSDLAGAIARLRADTPGCAEVAHFNHAGSSLMPRPVLDAVVDHVRREAAIGGYEAEDEAEARLDAVYGSIARLVGAAPDEIAIVENATRGWDMVFYALPLTAGDRILTSVAEYGSNALAFFQAAQRGVRVEVVPNDEHGQVSVAALTNMLDDQVKVIAVTHMPTNGGLVQPAAAIGQLAREVGALYLLDACQTAGQLSLDVEVLGCDVLSASARKFLRGPRGIGFVYVRRALADRLTPPFLDIRAATWTSERGYELAPGARRFENWESNVAGKLGMGAAVDYALALGLDPIWSRIQERAALLRTRLSELPGVSVHDQGEVKGGIVTFTVAGHSAEAIKFALRRQAINVSVSNPGGARWDMDARGLTELVRSSVHYLTTDEEMTRLCQAIAALD